MASRSTLVSTASKWWETSSACSITCKIDRAHIVGYSMGGAIAQQIVVKYPARVLTATLLGSGWEGEYLPQLTANMRAMADGFDRRDASGLLGAVSGGPSGMTDAQLAAATEDLFTRNDPKVLAVIARGSPPLWQVSRGDLERVRVPMLAISGERDQSNLDGARRMVGVVPGLQVIVLPGATHQTSVRPAAPHIVTFLDQHRQ